MTLPYIADCAAVTRWTGLSLLIPYFFLFFTPFHVTHKGGPVGPSIRSLHSHVCVQHDRPTWWREKKERFSLS
jgi:hypothetical protein